VVTGRVTATVLFTDLVGSTELRGRLGEEAADELRRKHDDLLTQVVEANSGRVVKGLGDGIMATFAGASDAVAATVTIQQGIDRFNRSGGNSTPLAVRVGLSAGDVTFEDADVHGTPVVEAARLCAAAAGGEILASEMVRWLGRAGASQTFTSVGALELKGLAEPVPAVRVEWEPAVASTIPRPPMLTDVGRVFVGRAAELERLDQLWKEAVAGERRVVFLAGEPGIGKTRLAAELAVRVHGDGALVLAGRCDEHLGLPYQPFVEALRHYLAHAPEPELGPYGGELVRLVPELPERVPGLPPPLRSDSDTESYRLFDAVAAWLAAIADDGPVLLVLDDLQWATKPTLLLLRHILHASHQARQLLIATYRDTEVGEQHPLKALLADLRRRGAVDRLPVSGFDASDVASFMEQTAGHGLDPDEFELAQAIYQETEGNPFFVRELWRHLVETGAMEQRKGRWTTRLPVDDLGIPEGVRDVVGTRLSRLSPDVNDVLRIAAVIGNEFDPAVVEVAGGVDEELLVCALEEAASARLILEASPTGRYRFAHALVRDTLYDDLSQARRRAYHRRVAEAVETVHARNHDDHIAALAYHWAQGAATPADVSRAAGFATRVGHRALNQLAHDEAARHYQQAIQLLDMAGDSADETRRIDLLIALAEAKHRAADPTYRADLLDAAQRAERLGDADRLARAGLAGSGGLWDTDDCDDHLVPQYVDLIPISFIVDAERVRILESALRARANRPDVTQAHLLAALAAALIYDTDRDRRRQLSDAAVALARELGDPRTLARVLLARLGAIWHPATVAERRAIAAELGELAIGLGEPFLQVWASLFSYEAAMEDTAVEEATAHLEGAWRSASQVEHALSWLAAYPRAGRSLLAGRLNEAELVARQALEIGLANHPLHGVPMYFGIVRFQIRLEQGRLDEKLVGRLAAVAADTRYPVTLAMLAQAYCELGRWDEAREPFEAVAAHLTDLPHDPNWIVTLARTAVACAELGETSSAQRLYDLLQPYSAQLTGQGVVWLGSIAHYLALLASTLGRADDAEAHFAEAALTHERIGAPTWLARTRLEWARMLLTRHRPGDADRARELLDQALATARELGLATVERQAVTLIGEPP
jgi:class 3 adenylate cyclase/tetratricopeptide (TPR) repeat protein